MDETMKAHEAGQKAAMLGEEMWRNPHSEPSGQQRLFSAWFAGWCYGNQQKAKKQLEDFQNMYRI